MTRFSCNGMNRSENRLRPSIQNKSAEEYNKSTLPEGGKTCEDEELVQVQEEDRQEEA